MAETIVRAILFDLDDTLLINDMDVFGPHYYKALLAKVKNVCSPRLFMEALDVGTRAMFRNDGTNGTNAEVFAREFFPRVGCQSAELMPLFDEFYTHDFESLRQYTLPDPEARPLMELVFKRGYQVAIATQPIFPLTAILARLRWANVDASRYPYAYVSSYETMSACKPHPLFFSTILERLGRTPQECLMVGDSLEADMAAADLGLKAFWVDRRMPAALQGAGIAARGTLRDLRKQIETGGINAL